jgi:hypothetical protein
LLVADAGTRADGNLFREGYASPSGKKFHVRAYACGQSNASDFDSPDTSRARETNSASCGCHAAAMRARWMVRDSASGVMALRASMRAVPVVACSLAAVATVFPARIPLTEGERGVSFSSRPGSSSDFHQLS